MGNLYIQRLKSRKKIVYKRLYAAVCLLLVSTVLLTSVSFAWLTLSDAPEVSNVTTTIAANGNLEIALGNNIGESAIGDSFEKNNATTANRTWGNLIDLTDESYGLQTINLRPSLLNSAGGAVNVLHPLAYPLYGADGRIQQIYANNMFAGTYNGSQFVTQPDDYGVRGIGTALYQAMGVEGTFGSLSLRQEIFYETKNNLNCMTASSWESLCNESENVLKAYYNGETVNSASDFNLDAFSKNVSDVVSAINEELRAIFTLLATSKTTSADNYFTALTLLEKDYPDYEEIRPLVSSAIQEEGVEDVYIAINDLRMFQNRLTQLQRVIDSDVISSENGYSKEEIEQTVGLIFDLEKTAFSEDSTDYWCAFIPDFHYRLYLSSNTWWSNLSGLTVNELTRTLYSSNGQDNSSREVTANEIVNSYLYSLYRSLPLGELDSAIVQLYSSHWSYWDEFAEDYNLLQEEITNLEKQLEGSDKSEEEILQINTQLSEKKELLQVLVDGEIFELNDEPIESIRMVMENTIETLRQYTLWSIAYIACGGEVKDDGYHRLLEIVHSTDYIHPRNAYQILCSYDVQPPNELKKMVAAYETLEQELLFLQDEPDEVKSVTWGRLSEEINRIFGIVEHVFYFTDAKYIHDDYYSSLTIEDTPFPIDVLKEIENEIDQCTAVLDEDLTKKNLEHRIRYKYVDENNIYPWAQALGLLSSFYTGSSAFQYGSDEYSLLDYPFTVDHYMYPAERFYLGVSVGVGSEGNFIESGLTQRQTKLKVAQEQISYYQNQLINAAVNPDADMVALIMQIFAGADNVSIDTISKYLDSLKQQLEYAKAMMYQATLAMAFSEYASDDLYYYVCSDDASDNVVDMIVLLQEYDFDKAVLFALAQRMILLNNQENLLNESLEQLERYNNPDTGTFATKDISKSEAVDLLNPVLDVDSLTLYGYVEQKQSGKDKLPQYMYTVLYKDNEAGTVNISGNQILVTGKKPVTIFEKVYLSLKNSFSGAMLAFAKSQTEPYTPPTGLLSKGDIIAIENGVNRYSYTMGKSTNQYTLNLHTEDDAYTLGSDLWAYTGNTSYISSNQTLFDVYGYSIDLSFRTNAEFSDLCLQTEAIDRIYNDEETHTDVTMGSGSYMEFKKVDPSLSDERAKEYMSCLRVVFTDTNTGYIHGYAALDMNSIEILNNHIKAPLRVYEKNNGLMNESDESQYLCHLEKNVEKNITVYVYLDGAKVSQSFVSSGHEQALSGVLNLQFSSSVELIPAELGTIK